jgi:predicted regulator of Ras-like GTPase activity (Roadblock/LC7/MglB family)
MPQAPEAPIFQKAPQMPQAPQAPVFQKAPQMPQAPEAPIFQKAPQMPQAPQAPVFQRAPQAPQFTAPPVAPQFAPAPPAAPAAEHPAPTATEPSLDAPLAALIEGWPEELLAEIEQLNLSKVRVALPVRVVDPALRQGKVAFTWKVLRSWIRPAIVPTVSEHDDVMLELPLSVIAPLFIGLQKQAKAAQQKVDVDDNIPNLFFGFPQPDSSAPVEEAPTSAVGTSEPPSAKTQPAAPAANPIFAPSQKPAGVPDTNYYVWGDSADTPRVDETEFKRKPSIGTEFLTRYATPNEVVSRAAALEGVVGALVALPDGLMVASKLSNELNGDTLAAFLPHIFGKISQCTKELRMGELNNLHFTVGNVPWKIFRVNAIFFAAFGRAGQPLPTAQLAALAAELDRKKQ